MEKSLGTDFPLHICILDVEIEQGNVQNPEGCLLVLIGVETFVLRNGSYQSEKYTWYSRNDLTALEEFLHSFDGLIIGHNIFDFDYRTLRQWLSLDGVVEKTVDTLNFLRHKTKKRGLSLDHLARANLGKKKTLDGESTPELWRQGKRDEVIDYNKNDCLLTMELWQHLVMKRNGIFRFYHKKKEGWSDEGTFDISDEDLEELIGKRPKYTYATWKKEIEKASFTLQYQEWQPDDTGLPLDISFRCHYCKNSDQAFLFAQLVSTGDLIKIECPGCGTESVAVREVYSLLGSVEGDAGVFNRQWPFHEKLRELITEYIETELSDL